ncbi:RIB43A-like with coiled-coils protein 2 [Trichoplax sp. H2]|nr:RIB43A-like with coiled-coils protein 2 [Trichoplax sp. H2]|eukprot:RDD46779.1 RIB43A-like with coiled-coils protein 2 [Trichoplax sp. H2]
MYKLDLPIDNTENAAIQRRRNQEIQRKSQIFDARTRIVGVDTSALNNQIIEKQNRIATEKARNEAFADIAITNDKLGLIQQERENEARKQLSKELNEYRKTYQQPPTRKEWDLNDPQRLLKDKPVRMPGNENCGISSVQVLQGEDVQYEHRKKIQAEQLRSWTQKQMEEKKLQEREEYEANKLFYMKACEDDRKALELEEAEKDCKRNINLAVKDYNLALANHKRDREQAFKKQEFDDNFTELSNHLHGDLLTENPEASVSAYGPHRVIPDRWKGMSKEQLNSIYEFQKQQRLDKMTSKVHDKESDNEWVANNKNVGRMTMLIENEQEQKRRALAKQFMEDNKILANEQDARKKQLNHDTYRNEVTEDFFKQFNTATR